MLIDMDTLCFGDGIFDLATMHLGISVEDAEYIWKRSLALYLGEKSPEETEAVDVRCRLLGLLRILDFANRGGDKAHPDIMIKKGLEFMRSINF